MKKKMLSAVLVMTLTLSALTGCGSNGEAKADKSKEIQTESGDESSSNDEGISGEITVITNRTDLVDTDFAEYKTAFEESHPGTTVNFEPITDYEGDVAIRMQTSDYGDVLMIPNTVKNTQFSTYFEPLGTVEELSGKYEAAYLNAKQSDGIVYGLPSLANAQGICYNKEVFANAGIDKLPVTPEEFLGDLKIIKDKGECENPYYTNFAAGWTLTQWQDHAWGTCTADPDYHNNGMPNEQNPFEDGKSNYVVHKLLFDIVAEGLCEKDPTTTDWEASKGMLARGEIGCMVLGSWAIAQMKEAAEKEGLSPDVIGYMPFPVNVNGKQYSTAGADYCYAININSSNKATARAWIDYMVDESGYALKQGSISIVKGDPFPDTLADFAEVEMIIDNPATPENEGKFDTLSSESEINLYAEPEKQRIVEAAMGSTKETFGDIMADWNTRWNEALDSYVPGE